ncbi:hypothetical protein ACIBKY_09255 [Nonomuraea sp. NPDC050394]|uniref:hypothetical protein n=1 Tax=Nonomuraea sp. NPDC050394 TaxID=3364363 RepID=UPI0037A5C28D
MPGTMSALDRIRPLQELAVELAGVSGEEATPLTSLAGRLETSQSRVEEIFTGQAPPNPVELTLVLVTLDPLITGAEIAAWQTCLQFAGALMSPTGYRGDPVKEVLRILHPLEDLANARGAGPSRREVSLLRPDAGLPDLPDLELYLRRTLEPGRRRAPWRMAYGFARQLLRTTGGPVEDGVPALRESWVDPRSPIPSPPDDEPPVPSRYHRSAHAVVAADEVRMRFNIAQQAALRDHAAEEEPQAHVLTIFLSHEHRQEHVESAVTEWLTAQGAEVVYEGIPIIGSLWKTFLTRAKKDAGDHLDDGMTLAARAAGLYGLDTRQAEVNVQEAEAFAKVMEAIADMDSAIIHHGTLLVVKYSGSVVRRELSQLEVEALRRNPALTARPDIILTELQRHAESPAVKDEVQPSHPSAG